MIADDSLRMMQKASVIMEEPAWAAQVDWGTHPGYCSELALAKVEC